jgi:hypothetical protein
MRGFVRTRNMSALSWELNQFWSKSRLAGGVGVLSRPFNETDATFQRISFCPFLTRQFIPMY